MNNTYLLAIIMTVMATNAMAYEASSNTPLKTVKTYYKAMKAGDSSPTLDVYAQNWKSYLQEKNMPITPAQMRLVSKNVSCPYKDTIQSKDRAVVRYVIKKSSRHCSPVFLKKEQDGKWRIDFMAMMNVIGFNVKNHWNINNPAVMRSPYHYAFTLPYQWGMRSVEYPKNSGKRGKFYFYEFEDMYKISDDNRAKKEASSKCARWQSMYHFNAVYWPYTVFSWLGKDSPFRAAGMQEMNDVIISVNGNRTLGRGQFDKLLKTTPTSEMLELEVIRNTNELLKFSVKAPPKPC